MQRGTGLRRYGLATIATVVALLVRLALGRYLVPPLILFYPTVILVALLVGPGPAIWSTLLSTFFVYQWVLPASGAPTRDLTTSITLLVFAAMGVLLSAISYRLEAARRAVAQQQFDLLAACGRDLILFVRQDTGKVFDANAAAVTAYGYSRDELIGLEAARLGVDDLTPTPLTERTHRRKNGESFPVETSAHQVNVNGLIAVVASRDLSSRRNAEAALSESERRYATVFAQAPFGLVLTTRDNVIVDANQAFFELFELTREGTIGHASVDLGLNDPQSRQRIGERFQREGRVRDVEVTRQTKSGQRRSLSLSVESVEFAGKPMVLSSMQDITERVDAQNRLAAERERLAVTLESIGDAVIATDRDAKVTVFNSVAETLTGRKASEALGHPLNDVFRLISEDTREPTLNPVERVLRDRKVIGLANHALLLSLDGGERPIANCAAPIRDPHGALTGVVLVFRDQTAERRTQAALRKSEGLLRTITDAVPDPIFLKDIDGRWLFANPAALAVIDRPADEVIGKTDRELYGDPSIGEALMANDRRVMQAGVPEVIEEQLPTKWGQRIYLSTKVPSRDEDGRVAGLAGVARDITDRKRLDETLREREYLLSESQRIAHVGTWTWDLATDVIRWSAETYRIHGVGNDFVPSPDNVLSLVHPDDHAAMHHWVDRYKAGEQVGDIVYRVLRPDGSVRTVRRRGELVAATAERSARLNGISQDITEQRLAEDRFRTLIDRSSDMIVVLNGEGRITFWSRSCERQLGFTAQEVLGRRGSELIHPEDWASIQKGGLVSSAGMTLRTVRRQLHKDGSTRLCEAVETNLIDDPAVRGVVVNMRDITAQRRLEDQLRQSQKLESIGQLAGGVAHDFNNLLTVILSCSEALQADLARGRATDPELLDEIATAGIRAADLTRQLLAFARKQAIAPVPVDLAATVRGCEKLLRRVLGEDIVLEVHEVSPPWLVRCDPGQFEQVILNLAVNARDAMPRGGTITIETDHVEVTQADSLAEAPPGQWVRLTVRDTGVGMNDEVKAHLFEPFFTTKGVGHGTGLGLATVYGIVTQSGGQLQVDSAPGRGTSIAVLMPRTTDIAASTVTELEELRRGTERILLVEDDPQVRASSLRALRSGGYEVLAMPTTQAALDLPQHDLEQVRLMVTDVVMPTIDGRTLADALRRRHPGLRVLFVSGYTRNAIAERGVVDSGLAFLAKPFTGPTLLARVRVLLDQPVIS
jgi:two-component system, cell cycle sensor histidine kinase and response regulator CckA